MRTRPASHGDKADVGYYEQWRNDGVAAASRDGGPQW